MRSPSESYASRSSTTNLTKLIMTDSSPTGFLYQCGQIALVEHVGRPTVLERRTGSGIVGEKSAVQSLWENYPAADAYAIDGWNPTRTDTQYAPIYFLRISD